MAAGIVTLLQRKRGAQHALCTCMSGACVAVNESKSMTLPCVSCNVTHYSSNITRHTLLLKHHTSHVTRHTSHVTHQTSHAKRHMSHVTRHTSHVTCHTSHVTRHTSHVTRHTSHITRHMPCSAQHLLHVLAVAAHDGHKELEESAAYRNYLHQHHQHQHHTENGKKKNNQGCATALFASPRHCPSKRRAWHTLPPPCASNAEPTFRDILSHLGLCMCGTWPGSGCSKACCRVTASPVAVVTQRPEEQATARLRLKQHSTEEYCYKCTLREDVPATVTRPSSTFRTSTSSIGMDMT
jgi:hypothetical protein